MINSSKEDKSQKGNAKICKKNQKNLHKHQQFPMNMKSILLFVSCEFLSYQKVCDE